MADKKPIKATYSGTDTNGLAEFVAADTIGVADGGTGLTTVATSSLLTGNGASALSAESNLTFDGTTLAIGNGSAADYLALRLYQGGGTSYYWDFTADVDAGDLIIGSNHSSFDLILNPSYGKVGIGTTAPAHTLHSIRNTTTADVFAGSFKDTTSSYQIQVHGTSGNVTGTHIENYMESPSPADGDFVGLYSARYKDAGGNKVQLGSLGWFADDVTAGTTDSKMEFKTVQNYSTKIAYLTAAGVWTDASAAAGKEYLGTRQEVWPDGILASLKTLNVSKYKPADQPEDKPVTETHVSPTAEDFWDALQIGTDPRNEKLNKDGENTNMPTIAAKDLGGVALVAIQELLERVEALESA